MRRLRTIVLKEWAEVFRNRIVIMTFGVMPLAFLAGAILTFSGIWQISANSGSSVEQLDALPEKLGITCDGVDGLACAEAYLGSMFLAMFMLLPILTPNSFAAYSVVGEKVSRTLEPLLATPVRTSELLLAKAVAAIVPALGATWLCAGLFGLFLLSTRGAEVLGAVFSPHWLLALLVFAPLMSVFAALVALMVSSLAKEPRTAEMIAGLVVTPFVLVIVSQIAGLFVLDSTLVLVASVLALGADLLLAWLAVLVFDRENILTRWR